MKRLLAFLAGALLLSACHFPQGWHPARTAANGSSATQTLVCWQNDVVGYQGPYLAYGASLYNSHPEMAVIMRDVCPTHMNRIIWTTKAVALPNWALTTIATGGSKHVLWAKVSLDPKVGRDGTVAWSKLVIRHEGCHGSGGGYVPQLVIHNLCNDWAHTAADLSKVLHPN